MRARTAFLVVLVVAGCLTAPAAAGAHAVVRHSTPHADQTVEQSPRQVVFDFNEPVGASAGSVRVYDERGRRVDDGSILRPRAASAGVRVPGDLGSGVYTATYRVVSADGHPVSGGMSFGIRAAVRVGRTGPTVDQLLADQQPGAAVEGAYGAVRALQYVALLIFLGAIPFWLLVWRAEAEAGAWPVRILRASALIGLITAALGVALQGLLAAGLHLDHLFSSTVWGDSLDTHSGKAWLARAILWLFALVVAWPKTAWGREHVVWIAVVDTALVATLPYGGHATTQSPEPVLVVSDVVHVIAAGVWLGGLVLLAAAFWPRRASGARPWLATLAFSRTAAWAIAAIVIAGSVQAWFYLGSLSAFVEKTYGIALLVKIALVVAIVALGAANRSRLRSRRDQDAAPVRAAIRAELVIAVGILAATAVLVRAAPPKAIANGPQQKELDLGPMRLEMVVEPAKVGRNAFHLYLFDRRTGAQISRVKQLTVTLAQPKAGIAPIDLDIPRKGVAHYELLGQPIPVAGNWTTTVTVRVSAFDEYSAKTTLRIRKP